MALRSHTFFFCQAEDGIRAGHVTGVQTCALPIYRIAAGLGLDYGSRFRTVTRVELFGSEERRVGKECRSRWSPYHEKKKNVAERKYEDLRDDQDYTGEPVHR